MYDVLIVGGGPAGLSAALVLGRCRRRVIICDAGSPRNAAARSMHNYLTREGMPPGEFLQISRRELAAFGNVEMRKGEVVSAARTAGGFRAVLTDGSHIDSRKLLLATGVVDDIPRIPGIEKFYGTSVHHCPYCDGHGWSDAPVAIYGKSKSGHGLSCELTAWTSDVVLCSDGPAELDEEQRTELEMLGIPLYEQRIVDLEGENGLLEFIVLEDGQRLARQALFFSTGQKQGCNIAEMLGCDMTGKGSIWTGDCEATNVPGLYCAGDASKNAQFVIVAASEGAQAATAINRALTWEALEALKSVKMIRT